MKLTLRSEVGAENNSSRGRDRIRKARSSRRLIRKFLSATKYYALGLYNNIDDDHCFMHAAGIAFNLLLSIIPISLLLLEVISTVVRKNGDSAKHFVTYFVQSIPISSYRDAIEVRFTELLTRLTLTGHWAGIIGGLTLLWLASALFSTLRTTLNVIFRLKPKSNSVLLKLLDFLMMLIVMALYLTLALVFPFTRAVIKAGAQYFPEGVVAFMRSTVPFVISLGASVALYYLLFRVLPYQKLPRKVVVVSALTTVILIESLKYGFAFYMQRATTIGALYGTYAFLVGIALWIYYVSLVFTISAEVGNLYWLRSEEFKRSRATTPLQPRTVPLSKRTA